MELGGRGVKRVELAGGHYLSRCIATFAGVLLVLTGTLTFATAPALAATEYPEVSHIDTSGIPFGVAVDQANGDVYVAEPTEVQRFIPVNRSNPAEGYTEGLPLSGLFAHAFGVAVDDSGGLEQGDVYVADERTKVVDKFNSSGMLEGTFGAGATPPLTEPTGVAVDPANGDVYVSDLANSVVDVYTPSGEFVPGSQFVTGKEPISLAFNSSGDLYVVTESKKVEEYEASGKLVGVVASGGEPGAVAVDPRTNDLYVTELVHTTGGGVLYRVAVYGPANEPLSLPEFSTTIPKSSKSFGIAVDETTHAVYLANTNTVGSPDVDVVEVFQRVTLPNVVIDEASEVTATSATLHGTINPDSETLAASYEFQCSNGVNYPASPVNVGTGMDGGMGAEPPPIPVTVNLTGLTPDTDYSCNLVGSNTGSSRHSSATGTSFTTLGEPVVDSESFSEVGTTTATVSARIDAGGTPTEYQFEYGTSASYGSTTPLASLGAAKRVVEVQPQLGGLQPGTTYHFRVLARSELGGRPGTDATFTTFPATSLLALPDGRVDEMVTPVDNHNANVEVPSTDIGSLHPSDTPHTNFLPYQASAEGDAVAYVAEPNGAGSGSATGNGNEYLATRAPAGGWTQVNLQPTGYFSPQYQAFSRDLSVGILDGRAGGDGVDANLPPLAAGAPGGNYDVLYACTVGTAACTVGEGATPAENPFLPLFTTTPPNRPPAEEAEGPGFRTFSVGNGERLVYAGASLDFSHLLFEANDALLSGGGKLESELREDVKLEVAAGEDGNDLYDSVAVRLSLVNVLPKGTVALHATFGSAAPGFGNSGFHNLSDLSHVISADGSRIFWTDLTAGSKMERVYVREDGERTIPVSRGPARFWTATTDGRYAYYTEGEKLWRFDAESETREEVAGAGAGVQGVIGVNEEGEDGAYVYFVANGVLAPNAETGDCSPGNGEPASRTCNLYLQHDGVTTFIAKLSEADDFGGLFELSGTDSGDWQPGLGDRSAEVTPDGRSLVFESSRSLTGYDSDGLSEVFVYDAGHLFCASCDPSGEAPPKTKETGSAAAYLPLSTTATYMPRWISDDGGRVFFDSVEPLSPRATNGRQGVYEWERYEPDGGTDSCTNAPGESSSESLQKREKGCIFLLSGGTSGDNSFLIDASASGNDVFFVTRAQLVAQDQNDNFNLFDARVGGVQPLSPPACSGTGCQGVPPAPPIFATPASATFNGVGNFEAVPSTPVVKPKAKPLTRAQKLANAFRTCRKVRAKKKRASCKRQARNRYGVAKKSSTSR